MRFEHQIAITSQTGVGSSSLLKALRAKLQGQPYRWVSGGGLMREKASQLGMTIDELAKYNRDHPEEGHDIWCDQTIAKMAEDDWMVCESRLAHFFMPGAFKALLVCDVRIRAARRQKDLPHRSVGDILREIKERDDNDAARYSLLYPGCIWREKQFDTVLSTEQCLPDRLAVYLLEEYQKWLSRTSNSVLPGA